MNHLLWTKILEYDFDSPYSEFGFSTRLSNENYWTKDFTAKAILEYKKFMYLAATSEFMVSPSEIIDTVWHQHLIFTQSYTEFCNLLGKQVQHIPSTHNKEDHQKFRQAKERTHKLYGEAFGAQPEEIWNYADMFDSLHLPKARWKLRTFIIIGILSFFLLVIPVYLLLRPVYIKIGNPDFIIGFIITTLILFLGLELYNRQYLSKTINSLPRFSFVYHLHPYELIYLKTGKLSHVIHGIVSQLVEANKILVNPDYSLEKKSGANPLTLEEFQVFEALDLFKRTHYPQLLQFLLQKPVFWNMANCMDAFDKYFAKSKSFARLFYINFATLSLLLLFGLGRIITGVLRDKPVAQIYLVGIALSIIIPLFLLRLVRMVHIITIPKLYRSRILSQEEVDTTWPWQYFLLGKAALALSFLPIVNYIDKHETQGGGDASSSCGSSCGSSCSSCGGCGGD